MGTRDSVYETEQFAPGEPPYEVRVEHANGWEWAPNAESWDMSSESLHIKFTDIGIVEYENGRVVSVR